MTDDIMGISGGKPSAEFLERLSRLVALKKTLEAFPPVADTAGAWREFLESEKLLGAATAASAPEGGEPAPSASAAREAEGEAAEEDLGLRKLQAMRELFGGKKERHRSI